VKLFYKPAFQTLKTTIGWGIFKWPQVGDFGWPPGTGITDALGNYLVNIPSLGNYIILVSKLGYGNVRTSDVIELSDMTPNWTVDISMGGKLWLMNKPYRTDSPRLTGTVGLVYTLLGDTRFSAVE